MQFGFCLLKYYYSYQVNEIICIEALHKDVCIKFGYITKMAYYYRRWMNMNTNERKHNFEYTFLLGMM